MNTLARESRESRSRRRRSRLVQGAWFSILLAAGGGAAFAEQERYTYFRSLEGAAELISQDGARAEAEANYPILVGDRLQLGASGRADVLLADGSQLTVDGGSELVFDDLAFSADGPAKGNVLRLLEGRIYLDSHGGWRGDHDQPVIDTQNARVYLQADGVYVVTASGRGYTEVTVRDGFAEVVDQRGSSIARAGESVEITGDQNPRAQVLAARSETEVEAWAREQEARHGRGSDPYLEQPLETTATLADHGDWLEIDSRRAWRPYVSVKTWRPYNNGRWAHTPRGLYWVSSDPWSPVVYHYGSWEYDMYHGWIWYPGYSWRPAHVYWYWGPSYTAWVPIGYYSRHYRGFYPGFGLRSGVYGWVGGRWDPFYDWTFCPSAYLRHRRPHHYYRSGRDFAHHGRLDRGILTTDTGYLGRDQWHRPELVRVALERGWQAERGGELQDVSPFVDRPGQLPENVARQVLLKPNPTGRGFDERVAAVLPRSGRGAGAETEAASGSGTRQGPVTRQGLGGAPEAGSPAAGTDRRILSRPGEADGRPSRAVSVDQTPRSAAGTRPTVSREGAGRPQSGSASSSGSEQPERGASGVTRTAVPRDRPEPDSSTDRRATIQRAPVPRATATPAPAAPVSRQGVTRQGVDTPREPARRVLDGIRGRSRPSSGGGEVSASAARPTVQRSPVPRSGVSPRAPSSTGARQPVSRPSAGAGNEAARRPVATTPPSRSGGTTGQSSASGRATVQRSPVATRPPATRPNSTASRPNSTASSARQPVRTPSRPSYSSPSAASRPSATRPSAATRPSTGSRYPASGARASSSSTRPTPAVRPPSAGTSRPTYSAPSRPAASTQRAPSSTYSRPAASSSTPRVSSPSSQRPSPSASRAPASSQRSSSAASSSRSSSASRATTSSSRAASRPSSSRPKPGDSR
jgi:hypothetical protein